MSNILNITNWSIRMNVSLRLLGLSFILFSCTGVALANDTATVWRLIDYLAVDYNGSVGDGKVVNAAEYAEMVEFSVTIKAKIQLLPPTRERPALIESAEQLIQLVAARSAPAAVSEHGRLLAARLIDAYPIPLAPSKVPNLARGKLLYGENCSVCHGAHGAGDGPSASHLDPLPVAFSDGTRALQRSVFGLYQVIDQGLDGTAMASYANLPTEDRWALAFYVGQFAFPGSLVPKGEKIWTENAVTRGKIGNLEQLVQVTPAMLASVLGDEEAHAVTAYLRRNPAAVVTPTEDPFGLAREKLSQAVTAYRTGDRQAASEHALSAYLDGVEPEEPRIRVRAPQILGEIEQAMFELRARIGRDAPLNEVRLQVETITNLFSTAESVLAPNEATDAAAFAGSASILLREGLEALLIVIAVIAFLRTAHRTEAMPYVHAGWISALAVGGLTWALATYAIRISGAQREVIEGVGSLFAAVVLISVGIWMHQKSLAGRWQEYLAKKLSHALSKRSAWFLFMLCFVAVYREVFETILFFAAMWTPEASRPIIGGLLAGTASLALIGWSILSFSRRLPIDQFFSVSSMLIAVLAVVLTGKGIAALQEAGWFAVSPLALPRIEWLGMYPSAQVIGGQLAILGILAFGYLRNRWGAREVRHR